MDAVHEEAPAKINLGLHVLALRGDGFHEIDTLMAALELGDGLTLRAAPEGIRGSVSTPSGPGFGEPLRVDDKNLVVRALRSYLEAAGYDRGIEVHLEKRIPLAAGLGGGSSDAAAALRGVARLYPSGVDLQALALAIGSDVPFFLAGLPAARARGRGERLSAVDLPPIPVVLANPGVAVPAREAYASLQNFTSRLPVDDIVAKLAAGAEPDLRNALQAGVMRTRPGVRDALLALRGAGLQGVSMSGSGATCFGIAGDAGEAHAVAERLSAEHPDWWIHASSTRT